MFRLRALPQQLPQSGLVHGQALTGISATKNAGSAGCRLMAVVCIEIVENDPARLFGSIDELKDIKVFRGNNPFLHQKIKIEQFFPELAAKEERRQGFDFLIKKNFCIFLWLRLLFFQIFFTKKAQIVCFKQPPTKDDC